VRPGISSNAQAPSKGPGEPTDHELVNRANGGDSSAFDALVIRHQDRVFGTVLRIVGNREDALDLSQEIFLTVFQRLDRFLGKAKFSTWLYRIAVNRCRDELRRRGFVKHTRPASLDATRPDGDPLREPASAAPAPEERAEAKETSAVVHAALAELPEEAREIVVLRDLEGLSYEETADVLEVPVGTVRSRLSRARVLLRDRLLPKLGRES